jgi:hypothetical protein
MLCSVARTGTRPSSPCLLTAWRLFRADARRGARRGRALPDGDREREVQRQGAFPIPTFTFFGGFRFQFHLVLMALLSVPVRRL